MPQTTELKTGKRAQTKQAILDHALFQFQKEGYESLTMRTLADSCNLSLGAFYYHFKSKEEIILEFFNASLNGHVERTQKHLKSQKPRPKLDETMLWICRDRFKEFEPYRSILRVLVQRLDPHDPISPWHSNSQHIRKQSVDLFDEVVTACLPNVDIKTRRLIARALWLQHLLLLGCWSFDRSHDQKNTKTILKQAERLWKGLPSLLRVPGVKSALALVLSPLSRFEGETNEL